MDIFGILAMVGGLALFLYGMQVLGDGLKRTSGGRLEEILESLTSNKWKGALLGCVVTAVIQSSSATTVMVVGLVNSGIMKLTQAAGVILGANVGTTVTSWMLSLTGIESSNVFVQLLKPANFSPIVGIIGVIMLMTAKNDKKKDIGTILIGFAVLMFGMETMSSAVEPLAGNEKFTGILTMFSNPILGMLAGLVLTAVIQSSSASIGILQALSMSGTLTIGSAIPILMGENIGTAITAILSSMGASKNAKRAALMHLYFCILKTSFFMVLFYLIDAIVHFPFMTELANPFIIAMIHSIFNLSAVVIMLPISEVLVKLAMKTIPVTPDELEDVPVEKSIQILDEIIKPVIAEPRHELSRYAPKMFSMMIPTDKIKDVIGKGGKVIQDICATCNCKIDVQEDGHVFVSAVDQEDAKRAIFTIKTIVEDPEIGAIYKGKVTRLMNFGAFVEIAPGKEGLVHISKLDTKRVERVEDVVAVGDAIVVKVTDIDQQGRINLSRRDAILALEAKRAEQQAQQ